MRTCPDCAAWCAYVDGEGSQLQRREMCAHLQGCTHCATCVAHYRAMRSLVKHADRVSSRDFTMAFPYLRVRHRVASCMPRPWWQARSSPLSAAGPVRAAALAVAVASLCVCTLLLTHIVERRPVSRAGEASFTPIVPMRVRAPVGYARCVKVFGPAVSANSNVLRKPAAVFTVCAFAQLYGSDPAYEMETVPVRLSVIPVPSYVLNASKAQFFSP